MTTETPNKQQSRDWMLTLPSAEYDLAAIEQLNRYAGWIGQLELASSGFEHWQIYVEHTSPIAFKTLRNLFPKGHFEPRRADRSACVRYVSKADTRVDGPFGSIDPNDVDAKPGARSDLDDLRQLVLAGRSIESIMLNEPRALRYEHNLASLAFHLQRRKSRSSFREIHAEYLWGATGVGKTHSVYERFGFENLHHVSDYQHPFDNYDGHKILFLDEFMSSLSWSLILRVLDKYPLELPARYHNRPAMFDTVIVAANVPLDRQYSKVKKHDPARWAALERRFSVVKEVVR